MGDGDHTITFAVDEEERSIDFAKGGEWADRGRIEIGPPSAQRKRGLNERVGQESVNQLSAGVGDDFGETGKRRDGDDRTYCIEG